MTQRHEMAQEIAGIRVVAADLHAKLLNSHDANEVKALSARLADLYERHEEIMTRIDQRKSA